MHSRRRRALPTRFRSFHARTLPWLVQVRVVLGCSLVHLLFAAYADHRGQEGRRRGIPQGPMAATSPLVSSLNSCRWLSPSRRSFCTYRTQLGALLQKQESKSHHPASHAHARSRVSPILRTCASGNTAGVIRVRKEGQVQQPIGARTPSAFSRAADQLWWLNLKRAIVSTAQHMECSRVSYYCV